MKEMDSREAAEFILHDPPDPRRCQTIWPSGKVHVDTGGRIWTRCWELPTVLVTDASHMGQMTMCDKHMKQFKESDPEWSMHYRFEPINQGGSRG